MNEQNVYGATKCFGEALAAYFAYTEGLPGIVLRIGAYTLPEDREHFDLSERFVYQPKADAFEIFQVNSNFRSLRDFGSLGRTARHQ